MTTTSHGLVQYSDNEEVKAQQLLVNSLLDSQIPTDELLANLGLFLTSKNFARLLFFYEIYNKIVYTHGVIMDFGTRWGQNIAVLSAIRGIKEPFNRHRKIIAFDTFDGLRGCNTKDGFTASMMDGSYSVSQDYEKRLELILDCHEKLNPLSHIRKFEILKGDVAETLPIYLDAHKETLVSMAILDMDIYKPTKVTLELLKPYLFKGSIVVFDELCDELFPGETIAFQEVFGANNYCIKRFPFASRLSYVEIL